MPKEVLPITRVPGDYRSADSVTIETHIRGGRRMISLTGGNTNYGLVILASDANRLGVKLFGMSEDHADPVPELPPLKPGNLVRVFAMSHAGVDLSRPMRGYYDDGLWRVSKAKPRGIAESVRGGHIMLLRGPGYKPNQVDQQQVEFVRDK